MEAEIDQEREEIEQMYEEERVEEQEKMREVGMARIRREACRRAFAAFRDAVEVKEWEENVEWEPLFVRRVEGSQMSCAFLRWVAWRREEAAKSERWAPAACNTRRFSLGRVADADGAVFEGGARWPRSRMSTRKSLLSGRESWRGCGSERRRRSGSASRLCPGSTDAHGCNSS